MPKCEATHRHANIEVAVAGERAQFLLAVVFSAVVALRRSCVCVCRRVCGWVPAKTASSAEQEKAIDMINEEKKK
ncbi:Nebulin [Trichinella spiralis]|uniref:Nebulin n=1 Tax=Trichinella spiralis TaxID=6334 RepID=A0ABR3KNU8_TRISP